MMQLNEVRRALQKRLRREVTDAMWSYLEEGRYPAEVAEDLMSIDDLSDVVRKIESAAARPGKKRPEPVEPPATSEPGQERRWALSQLVAVEMNADKRVVSFRERYLDGATMSSAEVERWIKERTENPVRTRNLTISVERTRLVSDAGGHMTLDPPLAEFSGGRLSVDVLDYAVPGEQWVHRVGVSTHSVLDQLRRLSEALAQQCAWQPAQATVFILTGVVPLISTVRTTTALFSSGPAWSQRIILNIDVSATVDEVVEAVRSVRKEQGLDKRRTISPKSARLAAFTLAQHVDKPWLDRQRLWNQAFPDWAYSNPANFRRDALAARSHLMHEGRG